MATMHQFDDAAAIRGYFKLGDNENQITRSRFRDLSNELGLTSEELDFIFVALDADNDGVITLEEILHHWNRPDRSSPENQNYDLNEDKRSSNTNRTAIQRRVSFEERDHNEEHDPSYCDNSNAENVEDFIHSHHHSQNNGHVSRSGRRDSSHRKNSHSSRTNQTFADQQPRDTSPSNQHRHSEYTPENPPIKESLPSTHRPRNFETNFETHEEWYDRNRDSSASSRDEKENASGVTPTIRRLRPKSPRPENVSERKRLTYYDEPMRPLTPKAELDPLSKPSQEQVCELYQNLHSVNNPDLVTQFESILLNVIKDVRQYQLENERLEKTYRREKDEHDKHLRRLEEEMEQQVQSVEERVRKQEKEKLESEKLELRNQLDEEIMMLQQNLKKLQQEGENRMDKGQEDHLSSMKKRLEEIHHENRSLKSELTDAQTNLALIRSQMTTVKQQLEEKNYELEVENKTIEDYVNEQDKLRRQLQMLHEANKALLDTNDNLREMLDSVPNSSSGFKRGTSSDFMHDYDEEEDEDGCDTSGASAKSGRSSSPSFPRKGSVMSDYVDVHPGSASLLHHSMGSSMIPRFLNEACEEESAAAEDLDSGHSTLRDMNDVNDDTEIDSVSVQSDKRRGRRHRKLRNRVDDDDPESHDEESDTERPPLTSMEGYRLPADHKRSPSVGSRGSNRSQRSLNRDESLLSQSSRSSSRSMRRQLPAVPSKDLTTSQKIIKDPERMYKIVLAGDAAVGKSSFIVRLCKGKFVPNLSSTLGVDFQTKMLEVDGQPTALQLWDTAGQERFRSVARTYFRRADGVLLLYDVTYERSFLNLREWVDSIEEGALKKIPIMLVGNKTDARQELDQRGRKVVKYEDGLRLSKEIDALFIETSAKDGANISEAVIELTRLLRTNEDMEVKSVGMQLHDMNDKKTGSCCKRS